MTEIRVGDPDVATRRLAIVEELPILEINDEVQNLVNIYTHRLGLTGRALADLPHIAFAVAYAAAEDRENSNQDTTEASTEHRQPSYYDISDSEYRFWVQDLISQALLYTHSVGRGDLGVFQFLEVTELGQAFIRFLEENHA